MFNPRLDLYRVFLTAAHTGSFTEAGNRLYMTQSAVSQAMAQLEQILETKLFYRVGRGMALTSEGETLSLHLSAAFKEIQAGEQALNSLKNLESGVLHIAASDTLCRHYLLPLLRQFHENFAEIHIQVTNRPSPACLEMIQLKEADLAFVNRSRYPAPPGVQLADVLGYEDIFVAAPPFVAYQSGVWTLEQILKEPLILLESGSSTRENLEAWAAAHEQELTPGIEAGSVDVILDLVRIGLGVGWIPGYALSAADEGTLFKIRTLEPPPRRTVALASPPAPLLSRAAEAFVGLVEKNSTSLQ